MGKEIILKVCNERVYFNWNIYIPIQKTNISNDNLENRRHRDFFCKVEILDFKSDDNCLIVSLKSYQLTDITGFNKQNPGKTINQLRFDKFDWNELEHLFYHRDEEFPIGIIQTNNLFSLNNSDIPSQHQIPQSPNTIKIEENFLVSFNESHFVLGNVTFKKYIKRFEQEIDFKVTNEHILAEFDNIKSWFEKILKTKKFKVSATIVLTENGISETLAFSKDIDKITPELIDSVKYERTYALSKAGGIPGSDKTLFTVDDIFSQIDLDNIEGNVFNQSDENILNFFLQEKDIRNKKQLEYLAGNKQSKNHKLRYTLNPDFGFLFMIEGTKYNHYVWELLYSNATYLWRIEKNDNEIELQFKRIEAEVNKVRTFKRANYKKAYKNDHQDTDIGFLLISHEDIISNPADNFSKWKIKLNEQLT